MKKLLFLLFFLPVHLFTNAQLEVDNTVGATQVVEDVFLGNGIFVANIVFSGEDHQIGTFNGSLTNVGISSGFMLATGDVIGAIGPNNDGSTTIGGGNFGVTDADLEIQAEMNLNDAAVLEFDFIATGDSLDFQFVFGSEEYSEFVGSFNDIFGFYVSGPGISGEFTNGAVNIALVPGTNTPVSINNINNGNSGTDGPCMNCEYYVHNGDGFNGVYSEDPYYIQCDGLTTVLHASIGNLVVGQVYHIKLAIADALDTAWDSYVFITDNSFVQFCTDEENIMPDVCLLSQLDAGIDYLSCDEIMINNFSDINVEFTNCYVEMGDGGVLPGCTSGLTYQYTAPGTYDLKLVYELNEFVSKQSISQVQISSTIPPTPVIEQNQTNLYASNWDNFSSRQWYLNDEPIAGAIYSTIQMTSSGIYKVAFSNSCGTVFSEGVTYVGVDNLSSATILLYPNPSEGQFQISSLKPSSLVRIFDGTGKMVYETISRSNLQVELHAAGIYHIVVSGAGYNSSLTETIVIH